MTLPLITCMAALLIGGIPFGYIVGRLVLQDDIRRHGSGNIGATNVGRVLGWKWGSLVLLLDALKGLLPTLAAQQLATREMPESAVLHTTIATGVAAIIGHMYPIYLKLRGGKGVATALGVVLVVAPAASAAALAAFLLTAAATRIVAIASMAAASVFAITQLSLLGRDAWTLRNSSLTAFAVVIPALIIWRHRSNIRKLLLARAGSAGGAAPVATAPPAVPSSAIPVATPTPEMPTDR